MGIRVIHSPGFGQLGALALAAGRSRRPRDRDDGFSDTQRAIMARDIARVRAMALIQGAAQRNIGRTFLTGNIESPEAKRRREQGELGQMVLTKQAEKVGREPTLNDREKKIALAQLDRRDKLLKRQERSPQEAFEEDIVLDRDTGLKYFRKSNGEYKQLESKSDKDSIDFSKAIETARKNLVEAEELRVSLRDKDDPPEDFDFSPEEIFAEAEKIIVEQEETTALAEFLQELVERGGIEPVDMSDVVNARGASDKGSFSFSRPSKSAAEREDPLAMRPEKKGEEDVVIDLGKMKPEEVMKQFKAMKPQDRREFLSQLNEDELKIFREHLPKAQRSAIRRAEKKLEEELERQRPSEIRIRDAEKKLARVLFEWGEQPKRKPMKTPMLGGY